jgi:hypothetical protein
MKNNNVNKIFNIILTKRCAKVSVFFSDLQVFFSKKDKKTFFE